MKRLILTQTQKETDEGTITAHVFQIQGEEADFSGNTVLFRPYEHMIKLIARDPANPANVVCETVYADGVQKGTPIPDNKGGNACGRTFPSWLGRALTPAEQSEQRAKAGYYGFLFGEVTFPGKAPQVVNLRMTSSVNHKFTDFQNTNLGRSRADWPKALLELKAKAQAKPQFSEISFNLKQKGLDAGEVSVLQEINSFIEEHNSNIKSKA